MRLYSILNKILFYKCLFMKKNLTQIIYATDYQEVVIDEMSYHLIISLKTCGISVSFNRINKFRILWKFQYHESELGRGKDAHTIQIT